MDWIECESGAKVGKYCCDFFEFGSVAVDPQHHRRLELFFGWGDVLFHILFLDGVYASCGLVNLKVLKHILNGCEDGKGFYNFPFFSPPTGWSDEAVFTFSFKISFRFYRCNR
ncbi:hypothetical protein NPIL_124651 [Nephila pilipes]|uniref:Uncharacterized protein n=1 Tax=Nephila pilipes TaxID=299642 RepID=A0A8X6MK88_NEPPI|nr:hypothetical protein NPIL_124651 [Nephila pilipes]